MGPNILIDVLKLKGIGTWENCFNDYCKEEREERCAENLAIFRSVHLIHH